MRFKMLSCTHFLNVSEESLSDEWIIGSRNISFMTKAKFVSMKHEMFEWLVISEELTSWIASG